MDGGARPERLSFPGRVLNGVQTRWPTRCTPGGSKSGRYSVAVSHSDPIKTAVAHALGTPLDLFQRIAIGTASVSAIAYGRIGPTVLTVNSTGGDLTAFAP